MNGINKVCSICGKSFVAKTAAKDYCSEKCQKKRSSLQASEREKKVENAELLEGREEAEHWSEKVAKRLSDQAMRDSAAEYAGRVGMPSGVIYKVLRDGKRRRYGRRFPARERVG